MTTLFKDDAAKARVAAEFARWRALVPAATSRTVSTRFGETHALVAGPEDAPPLVVLHGALDSSAHAMFEIGPLRDHFRVYALDVLGQSVMSADARVPVDGPAYGEWLRDALDGLGLERASIYGVSWGGFVARRLAEVAPDRIDRLVLLVPAGIVGGPAWRGLTEVGIPMALYRAFPSEARLRRFARGILSELDDDWVRFFGVAFSAYKLDMRIPPLAERGPLAGFKRPTLVFGASEDVSFPGEALLARAKELFPQAELELLAGLKHAPPSTDAFRSKMADRIASFLGSDALRMSA